MNYEKPHQCPKCGQFTRGHAYSGENSAELWFWSCAKGHSGSEGY